MKTTDNFVFFWDGIYSNWTSSPFAMRGQLFVNSEQAFMWLKAIFFGDTEIANQILNDSTPSGVKALGRKVKGYDDAKWSQVRFDMMYEACLEKFGQNPEFGAELLSTGNRTLVEASPYDKIWGIGLAENAAGIEDKANWQGLNLLGEVLMKVRATLRNEI